MDAQWSYTMQGFGSRILRVISKKRDFCLLGGSGCGIIYWLPTPFKNLKIKTKNCLISIKSNYKLSCFTYYLDK